MDKIQKLTVSEFNTEPYFGTMQYVDIDVLRFIRDKDCTNIVVQVLEDENFIYFDEFEPNKLGRHHNDLLIMAQEWIIKHVKITSTKE